MFSIKLKFDCYFFKFHKINSPNNILSPFNQKVIFEGRNVDTYSVTFCLRRTGKLIVATLFTENVLLFNSFLELNFFCLKTKTNKCNNKTDFIDFFFFVNDIIVLFTLIIFYYSSKTANRFNCHYLTPKLVKARVKLGKSINNIN